MAGPDRLNLFVELRCLCGKLHTLLREKIVQYLGRSRWKCGTCKRRFVVACTPGTDQLPETFWPLFLEKVPSTGDTQEMGLSTDATPGNVPAELPFRCRCGCRLVGRPAIYDRPARCPRCQSRIVVRVGYESDKGVPIPLLAYPDDETQGIESRR